MHTNKHTHTHPKTHTYTCTKVVAYIGLHSLNTPKMLHMHKQTDKTKKIIKTSFEFEATYITIRRLGISDQQSRKPSRVIMQKCVQVIF